MILDEPNRAADFSRRRLAQAERIWTRERETGVPRANEALTRGRLGGYPGFTLHSTTRNHS